MIQPEEREVLAQQGNKGPIGVVMYTLNGEYKITKGDKIAQMIIQPYVRIVPTVVDKLPETVRGQGGFGSTGV